MLKKLIKHDFRAFSRILLPLQLGVLGGGVLATILTRLSLLMVDSARSGEGVMWRGEMVLSFLFAFLTVVLMIAIFASALITLLLICIRLQKSFFGDEGYLTFSLPVSADKLLWSKLITGAIWIVINGAVIAVTMFLFGAFGTAQDTFFNPSVLTLVANLFGGFGDLIASIFSADALPGMWLMAILGLLDLVAFVLLQLLLLYFAVIAGGRAAKRYWLLAAVGIYLLASFCTGFLTSICGVLAIPAAAVAGPVGAAWIVLIGALVLLGGLSAGLYFWSRRLLTSRLNLQ